MSVAVVQLIQMITAVDVDEPQGGQHFSYSLAPEVANNPNFTLRDNQGTEKTREAHENVCKDSKYDHLAWLHIAAPSGQAGSLHHKSILMIIKTVCSGC